MTDDYTDIRCAACGDEPCAQCAEQIAAERAFVAATGGGVDTSGVQARMVYPGDVIVCHGDDGEPTSYDVVLSVTDELPCADGHYCVATVQRWAATSGPGQTPETTTRRLERTECVQVAIRYTYTPGPFGLWPRLEREPPVTRTYTIELTVTAHDDRACDNVACHIAADVAERDFGDAEARAVIVGGVGNHL